MTPEELKEFREWCRTFEVSVDSMIMKALTHIDQQATALDEAEALIKKNADQINALLAQVAALKEIAVEERKKNITPPLCNCRTCTSGSDFVERRKHFHEKQKELARTQLAKEHPEVDWK